MLQHGEHVRHIPRAILNVRRQMFRQHARNVFNKAAARNVRNTMYKPLFNEGKHAFYVNARRLQKLRMLRKLLAQNRSHEAKAVGMHARRSNANKHVALMYKRARKQLGALGNAHAKARKVKLLRLIEAWHLGHLAANK